MYWGNPKNLAKAKESIQRFLPQAGIMQGKDTEDKERADALFLCKHI